MIVKARMEVSILKSEAGDEVSKWVSEAKDIDGVNTNKR